MLFGPKLILDFTGNGIVRHSKGYLYKQAFSTPSAALTSLISIYYAFNLSYPRCYSPVLGFIQGTCIESVNFTVSHKVQKFIQLFNQSKFLAYILIICFVMSTFYYISVSQWSETSFPHFSFTFPIAFHVVSVCQAISLFLEYSWRHEVDWLEEGRKNNGEKFSREKMNHYLTPKHRSHGLINWRETFRIVS